MVPGLIHKCYLAKRDDTAFVVFGSGQPLRQFIYSKDLAQLMVWAICHYNEAEPIIFSPAEEVSIAAVARCIADAFHFSGDIIFDTSKADGQFKKTVSNQKLREHLGDFCFTSLHQGLTETVAWFMEHYDDARK